MFGIQDWWGRKVEELSKGMAQKVQFIVTVLHNPQLLIFDEPFSGFDPINANMLKEQMMRLKDRGATIIFSTHNMSSVEEVCDHITLINRSKNILSGPIDQVRRSFGSDTYTVDFSGDINRLEEQLSPLCSILGSEESQIRFCLDSRAKLRQVISVINSAVEIRRFSESIPSMNDIFIRAVQSSNTQGA